MKFAYDTFKGILTFFFIVALFEDILVFSGSNLFADKFIPAMLFGLLVAALPALLGFVKIKDNFGALLIGGIVVNFLFYFIGYYALSFFNIVNGTVIFGFDTLSVVVNDKTLGLLLISIISSSLVVALEALSRNK